MDKLIQGNKTLIIWSQSKPEEIENFVNKVKSIVGDGNISLENSERLIASSHGPSTFDAILSNLIIPQVISHTDSYLAVIWKILRPAGRAILFDKSENFVRSLKLNGFTDVEKGSDNIVVCRKPAFEVGSALKIVKIYKLAVNKVETVFTLNKEDDIIDSDMLLDEDDLKKPDPATLRVCGTTGQRKACADCSCGLAEELRGEVKETPKSSCGSCYLGDAFRCASCPYLGMPAFKPGEKVLLADLKPDI